MKRRWNRIPITELFVCFGHVRTLSMGPRRNRSVRSHRGVGPPLHEKYSILIYVVPLLMGETFFPRDAGTLPDAPIGPASPGDPLRPGKKEKKENAYFRRGNSFVKKVFTICKKGVDKPGGRWYNQ